MDLEFKQRKINKVKKSFLIIKIYPFSYIYCLKGSFYFITRYIGIYIRFSITQSNDVLMMLASGKLKVALATTHIPLKEVHKKNKNMTIDSDLNIFLKKNTLNPNSYVLWEICWDNCNQYTEDNI